MDGRRDGVQKVAEGSGKRHQEEIAKCYNNPWPLFCKGKLQGQHNITIAISQWYQVARHLRNSQGRNRVQSCGTEPH